MLLAIELFHDCRAELSIKHLQIKVHHNLSKSNVEAFVFDSPKIMLHISGQVAVYQCCIISIDKFNFKHWPNRFLHEEKM